MFVYVTKPDTTSQIELQEYSFQITLRQQWNDGRLKFKDRIVGMEGKDTAMYYYMLFPV